MTPLKKLPKNVGDLSKIIVPQGFKKLPKVQKNAKSGHTGVDIGIISNYHHHQQQQHVKVSLLNKDIRRDRETSPSKAVSSASEKQQLGSS